MENIEILNSVVLVYVAIYGIALGFKNYLIRLKALLTNKIFSQNNTGRFLDASMVVGTLYLYFLQNDFLVSVVNLIKG